MERVSLYDEVLRLPDGFDTRLNGAGQPLSGTQRDLLCLARGLAGQPRLLLVDGLLDSLADDELETAISSLTAADRTWTLIISTGRKAIAERCNQVVQMHPAVTTRNPNQTTSQEVSA